MSTKSETLNIEGMSCNHCVSSVTNALSAAKGVKVDSVEIGKASVTYDTTQVTHEELVAAVEEIGFSVNTNSKIKS